MNAIVDPLTGATVDSTALPLLLSIIVNGTRDRLDGDTLVVANGPLGLWKRRIPFGEVAHFW
jgi:hypothetical protein